MVVTPTLTVSAGSFHRPTDFPKERNNKVTIRPSAGAALEVSGTLLTTIVETMEDGSSQWRVAALDLETGCVGATTDAYPWDAKLSTFQGHTTGDGTAAWQVVTNGKAFMLGVDALGGGDISVKYSCNLDTPYVCLAHDGNSFWGCTSKTHISKWAFGEECKPESGGLANVLLDQPVIGGTAAIDQSTGTFWQRFSKPSTDDNTTLWYGNWVGSPPTPHLVLLAHWLTLPPPCPRSGHEPRHPQRHRRNHGRRRQLESQPPFRYQLRGIQCARVYESKRLVDRAH